MVDAVVWEMDLAGEEHPDRRYYLSVCEVAIRWGGVVIRGGREVEMSVTGRRRGVDYTLGGTTEDDGGGTADDRGRRRTADDRGRRTTEDDGRQKTTEDGGRQRTTEDGGRQRTTDDRRRRMTEDDG